MLEPTFSVLHLPMHCWSRLAEAKGAPFALLLGLTVLLPSLCLQKLSLNSESHVCAVHLAVIIRRGGFTLLA